MDQKGLNQPVTTGGVRLPTFYNGRVLTAEDLQQLQAAEGALRQQVARAGGSGVAWGLTCTAKTTSIEVDGGLAVAADGSLLFLADAVEVLVTGVTNKSSTAVGFQDCGLKISPQSLTGEAPYLLVVGPAQATVDSAPQVWPTASGKITGCGPGSTELGVKFRLVTLPWTGESTDYSQSPQAAAIGSSDGTPIINQSMTNWYLSRLRSELALSCFDFGSVPSGQGYVGPFAASQLRADGLLAQNEVPLCLFYWHSGEILFLDEWAVRRRVEQPLLGLDSVGPLHLAEGEALSQQFQTQLATLKGSNGIVPEARSWFHAIPAAGFVPTTLLPGFFSEMYAWQDYIHPGLVRQKLWESFLLDPIDPRNSYGAPVRYAYLGGDLAFYWVDYASWGGNWLNAAPTEETPKAEEVPGALTVQLTANGGTETEKLLAAAKVTAVDADGKSYTGRIKKAGRFDSALKGGRGQVAEVSALRSYAETPAVRVISAASVQFELTGLPPSDYLIQVSARGFKSASKKAAVKASQSGELSFNLLAGSDPTAIDGLKDLIGKKGRKGWKADFLPKRWWGKGWAVPGAVKYPPTIPPNWERVVDPPDALLLELAEIGEEVKAKYPKAAVDPGEVQIWIDPAHTPASTPKEPYAWAQFGDGGAAVPLILTGSDLTLDRSIGLAKVEIDGTLDEQALEALGIAEVDALAGIWTGLLTQLLQVPDGAANNLVKTARTAIDGIKGTAREWVPDKPAVAGALADRGLADATKLANKQPEALVEELKEHGVEIEAWEAERIVREAREAVPKSTWAVESIETLSTAQVEALAAKGIATQEELKAAAESDPAMVAKVTGMKVEEVASVVTAIEGARTEAAVTKASALPVTQVVEAESTVLALGQAGLGTLGALAKADLGTVTAALGGDVATATQVFNLAKARFTF